jgi:hypothetical protein
MLFPWLYPSGNGDFNESRKVDIGVKDWARQQLLMADDRFAKYKTWCFYALNYYEHRRNITQGQWFVNNFLHSEEILCIDSLKEKLKIRTQNSLRSYSELPSVYQDRTPIGETKELS